MKTKNFRILVAGLLILILLGSCGTVKEAFSTQKKDNTDEFLVEKKNPLKLPPDFDDLPEPKSTISLEDEQKDSEIKSLITNSKDSDQVSPDNNNSVNKTLEETLLDKIKKN